MAVPINDTRKPEAMPRKLFVSLLKEINPRPTSIAPISGNTGIIQAYSYIASMPIVTQKLRNGFGSNFLSKSIE